MVRYQTLPIDDITEVTVEGGLDLDRTRRLLLDTATNAQAAGHNLLVDLRNAESTLSFRDVYHLVQLLGEHPEAFSGRIALLDVYDERFEKAQFFESSATEIGFEVRTFLDEDEAVAWLAHG